MIRFSSARSTSTKTADAFCFAYLMGYTQGEQSDEVEIKDFLKKMVSLDH